MQRLLPSQIWISRRSHLSCPASIPYQPARTNQLDATPTHSCVPQVFGVTRDPFIVYTSNLWAILSLRGLYGFVSTFMQQMRYLDKAGEPMRGAKGGQPGGRQAGMNSADCKASMPALQARLCCKPYFAWSHIRCKIPCSRPHPAAAAFLAPLAVAVVLGFVGGKILADYAGYSVSTEVSLGVVAGALSLGVVASLLSPKEQEAEKEA